MNALMIVLLSGLAGAAGFVVGLHYSESYTRRALRRSWARERGAQEALARTMDAYNKVVERYNRDIGGDDSKQADWWKNCDP